MRNAILVLLVLLLAISAHAQQVITLLELVRLDGTVKSVSPGVLVVTDSAGKDVEFKIQPKDEEGVSLGGAKAIVRFPAKVELSGTLPRESVAQGTVVQFSGRVNRLGRTEGQVARLRLVDEMRSPLGLEIAEQPAKPGDFATCTITAEAYSLRDNRLIVNTPKNDFCRTPRLSFPVGETLEVSLESDDYRRAKPGDKVVSLTAARFSTGDSVIKEVTIEVAGNRQAATEPADRDLSKYRQLSDQPVAPRDLRSTHFLLHTDISDRSAKILLDKLETMIVLVSQYFGRPPAQIIECYVVRDLPQWPAGLIPAEAVAKINEPAGVTLSVTMSASGAGSATKSVVYSCAEDGVVQHEAVHAYCSQTFGSTGPTWYAEGVAEMGHYWKKDQLAVDVEPVVIDYLKNSPPKQLLDIVAAGQITGDSWRAYAWRWALCYMLASNPNYSGRFKALGLAMMNEQPGASFESVYGPVAREISFEYDFFTQHLDNGYRSDLCAWQWNRPFQYVRGAGHVSAKVLAKYGWQASGMRLESGQSYDYAAKGTWKAAAAGPEVDANGGADGTGRLTAVLMQDFRLSEPFDLGVRGSFVASQTGDLHLRCRDGWNSIGDNDGSLTVYLRKTPGP